MSRCSWFGIRILTLACFCTALTFGAAAQVFEQYTTTPMGYTFNNPMSALVSTMLMNHAREQAWAKQFGSKPAGSASRTNEAPRKADDGSTRFRSARTFLKTKEIADQLGSTPEQRQQYRVLIEALLQEFEKKAAEAGKPHDLAMALAYFLGENARIYHGQPEVSDQRYFALRDLVAIVLSGSSELKNAPDAQKQEMYEGLIAYTGMTQFGYEQSVKAGNQQFINGYRQVAGQNLRVGTKLSPDAINFTEHGLTIDASATQR
jgi:Family of unknown function (DUF6683)